jgi:hypothetical protein
MNCLKEVKATSSAANNYIQRNKQTLLNMKKKLLQNPKLTINVVSNNGSMS